VQLEDGPVPQFTTIARRRWVGEKRRAFKEDARRTVFEIVAQIAGWVVEVLIRLAVGLIEALGRHL
jgi:hypothetical protein